MRIIAGQWRSRQLIRPKTADTRPMPDRVRESIFDILGSHFGQPGTLPPLVVADLFAGSGSMGLESLSRGAGSCFFLENGRLALDALKQNISSLDAKDAVTVVVGDAWRTNNIRVDCKAFDLVFLDPPYADSADPSREGAVCRYLEALAELDVDRQKPQLVVLHHRRGLEYDLDDGGPWRVLTARRYGSSGICCFER